MPAVALAVAGQVGRDHAAARGDAPHGVHPHHRRRAGTVHKAHRRLAAFAFVANAQESVAYVETPQGGISVLRNCYRCAALTFLISSASSGSAFSHVVTRP